MGSPGRIVAGLVLIVLGALSHGCSMTSAMLLASGQAGQTERSTPTAYPTRTPYPTTVIRLIPTAVREVRAMFDTATPTMTVVPTQTPKPATRTSVPATRTPTVAPVFLARQDMNVRSGPGTGYLVAGSLAAKETLAVSAISPDGVWLQVSYQGKRAWVSAELGDLNVARGAIPRASSIPPTPLPTPTRRPGVTAGPTTDLTPMATPVPSATPTPWDGFTMAIVVKCEPQAQGSFFHGIVSRNGKPANGYRVVFSDTPGGGWSSQPAITGPHPGYWDWAPGYYRHTIGTPPEHPEGNWYAWIVDETGYRISSFAGWHTTGGGGNCHEATINFAK